MNEGKHESTTVNDDTFTKKARPDKRNFLG